MLMCCGEIAFRRKKLYIPFLIVIGLDFMFYQTTLFVVASSSSPTTDCIDFECLSTIFDQMLNNLGLFISISAILSMFGKYIILLSAHSRSLWAISQSYITLLPNGKMYIIDQQDDDDLDEEFSDNDQDHQNQNEQLSTIMSNIAFDDGTYNYLLNKISIGILPSCIGFGRIWNKTQSPVNAVLFTTFVNAMLILFLLKYWLKLQFLSFNFIFKIFAFLKLRYTAPLVERPFKIIGGVFVAWIVTVSQLLVIIFIIFITIQQKPNLFIFAIGINVIIVMFYLFTRYSCDGKSKMNRKSNSYLLTSELSSNQSYNTTATPETPTTKEIW